MKFNLVNTYDKTAFKSLDQLNYTKVHESCVKEKGLKSNTWMFRHDLNWEFLSNYIIKNFPSKTKIYNFACSDGSEIYSLKMLMDKKIKETNADKEFEYLAFDINKELIEQAQNHEISISPGEKPHFNMQMGHCFDNYFEKVKETKDTYKVIDKNLTDEIKFEYGDITQWAKQKQDKPCVVMFRNAWPYLKFQYQRDLFYDLAQNLAKGSLLVIGDYDKEDCLSLSIDLVHTKNFSLVEGSKKGLYGENLIYEVN